ncbi:MAG: hypothetical protein AAGC74_10235 [Verrucomicrobiota bacterium]
MPRIALACLLPTLLLSCKPDSTAAPPQPAPPPQALQTSAQKPNTPPANLTQAKIALAQIEDTTQQISQKLDLYTERFGEHFNWKSLARSRDYERHRRYFTQFRSVNRQVIDSFASQPAALRTQLDQLGFQGPQRQTFVRDFLATHQPTLDFIALIRICDIQACDVALRIIDLLQGEGIKWDWNDQNNTPSFQNPSTAKAYDAEIEKFRKIVGRQVKAQQDFVDFHDK